MPFIMDVDDIVIFDEDFDRKSFKEGLAADLYHVRIRRDPIWYNRPLICSNRLPFTYRGVVHEFLEGPPGVSTGVASGFYVLTSHQGARSQDPEKYLKDAQVLEVALSSEQDEFLRSRYTFISPRAIATAATRRKRCRDTLNGPGSDIGTRRFSRASIRRRS